MIVRHTKHYPQHLRDRCKCKYQEHLHLTKLAADYCDKMFEDEFLRAHGLKRVVSKPKKKAVEPNQLDIFKERA